jgi:hypothetical protein
MRKVLLASLLGVGLFAIWGGSAMGSEVYIVSAGLTGDGIFGTVDLGTGAFHQIGPGEPDGYFGLASGPNGSLLSLTYTANLDSINPATGVPTRVGPTGLGSCLVPDPSCGPTTAFAMGSANGTIYATDIANDLYTINPLTGAATLLSKTTGIPESPFVLGSQNADGTFNFADEAIWGAGGKLYLTYDAFIFDPVTGTAVKTVVAPALYEIDTSTGHAISIGSTELGIGGAVTLNGTTYVFNDPLGEIETLDLTSGKTVVVGSFDPAAGVIQGAAAVPEPMSLALLGVGFVGLALWKRRSAKRIRTQGGSRGAPA